MTYPQAYMTDIAHFYDEDGVVIHRQTGPSQIVREIRAAYLASRAYRMRPSQHISTSLPERDAGSDFEEDAA